MFDEDGYEVVRPRHDILGFMCGLCVQANEMRAAEGYLLELLAWASFAPRPEAQIILA